MNGVTNILCTMCPVKRHCFGTVSHDRMSMGWLLEVFNRIILGKCWAGRAGVGCLGWLLGLAVGEKDLDDYLKDTVVYQTAKLAICSTTMLTMRLKKLSTRSSMMCSTTISPKCTTTYSTIFLTKRALRRNIQRTLFWLHRNRQRNLNEMFTGNILIQKKWIETKVAETFKN